VFYLAGVGAVGKTKSYAGVRLGFTNGNLMQDETGYLDKGDRKQLLWKDF
jgi:hypothetical protein